MNTFKIKPEENFKLLGTSIKLSKRHWYTACDAISIPKYKKEKAVFVFNNKHNWSFLLKKGEYTTKGGC